MQQNMGKMLKGITQLQQKVDAAQKSIADSTFTGEAAQGLVVVTMTGRGEVSSVTIDPSALTEDAETVAALFAVATNKAYAAKEAFAKDALAKIGKGALPFGLSLPGLG